jgi:hypothetical protein
MKFLFPQDLLCCPVVGKRPYVFSTVASFPQYEDTQEASRTKNKTMHLKKGNVQTDGPPPESIALP